MSVFWRKSALLPRAWHIWLKAPPGTTWPPRVRHVAHMRVALVLVPVLTLVPVLVPAPVLVLVPVLTLVLVPVLVQVLTLKPLVFAWQATSLLNRTGDYRSGQKGAIVEMFGWPHLQVALECPHLAKAGYMGVKVYPPQESVMSTEPFNNMLNPWYFFYQPVSHSLDGQCAKGYLAALAHNMQNRTQTHSAPLSFRIPFDFACARVLCCMRVVGSSKRQQSHLCCLVVSGVLTLAPPGLVHVGGWGGGAMTRVPRRVPRPAGFLRGAAHHDRRLSQGRRARACGCGMRKTKPHEQRGRAERVVGLVFGACPAPPRPPALSSYIVLSFQTLESLTQRKLLKHSSFLSNRIHYSVQCVYSLNTDDSLAFEKQDRRLGSAVTPSLRILCCVASLPCLLI